MAGGFRHSSAKQRRNLDGRARLKADSAATDHNIPGHDTFVFAPDSGNETIMNLQNGYDKPGLSAQGFSSIAGIDHEFVGKDPLIDLDGSPEDLAAILIVAAISRRPTG